MTMILTEPTRPQVPAPPLASVSRLITAGSAMIGPYVAAFLNGVAEILFLRGSPLAVVILLAMLTQPSVLVMGLIGVAAAYLFAHVFGLGRDYLAYGFYVFNPFLAGLAVGYLFQPQLSVAVLAALSGILAFLVAWGLGHLLRTYLFLPVLSLPFVIVSWVVHLAALRYSGLPAAEIPSYLATLGLPVVIEGFLRTLGFIFFLPNIWVGLAVATLMLAKSRIAFGLAAGGYALGTWFHGVMAGSFAYVYFDPIALNYILVALALGGFYVLPSPRSLILAALGVVLSVMLGDAVAVFWSAVHLPVHALPYNLITLLMLYVLGLKASPLLARAPLETPERTLEHELPQRRRHRGTDRTLALPFSGRWTVWQGCDGPWTHQGAWRHACDFVITDEDGQTFRGDGLRLTDYHAFMKPVLSPVRGWVVRTVATLPDGALGSADQTNRWGNLVVLYDDRGFYVELSHFAENSITVKAGDRVDIGAFLGRCGNSGFSPQPHLHLQVQLTPEVGAPTAPFTFADLIADDRWNAEAMPVAGARVEPAARDTKLVQRLSFALDSTLSFSVIRRNSRQGSLSLTVRMASDGSLYFDSGAGRLYFTCRDGLFIAHALEGNDPGLCALFAALPRLPLTARPGATWTDTLPLTTTCSRPARAIRLLAGVVAPRFAVASWSGRWTSAHTVEGTVSLAGSNRTMTTRAVFSPSGALIQASAGDVTLDA